MALRVQSGAAKGKRLKAPRSTALRPTSSRVKGALFNILAVEGLDGARVLELFAGTGAMGIEALSLGASHVDFVERDPRTCQQLRENLLTAGLLERAAVHKSSAARALTFLSGPFDLVLMDPPYADDSAADLLDHLASPKLLAEMGLIVLEHATRNGPAEAPPGLQLSDTRRYGDTALSFYRRCEAA